MKKLMSYDYFAQNPYFYISFLFNVLAMDEPKIKLVDLNKETAFMTTYKAGKDYEIAINHKLIDNDKMLIVCLTHEIRHIYQLECISKKLDYESNDTIEAWKNNIENYQDSSVEGYELSEIEIDANAFAMWMMNLIFKDQNFFFKGMDTNKFIKTFAGMRYEFQKEDIDEAWELTKEMYL